MMKVTITSIELKGPFKFFALSYRAMNILPPTKGYQLPGHEEKRLLDKTLHHDSVGK